MRTQQPLARPILIYAAYVFVFAILQVTILPEVSMLKVRPDLTLILAILTGYLFGRNDGLFLGLAAGFLRDVLAGRALGLGMLLLMYAALAAHYLLRDFFRRKTWMGLVQIFLVTLLYELALVLMSWFFPMLPDQVPSFRQMMARLTVTMPLQGLVNMVFGVPTLLLLRFKGPYDPRVLSEDLDDGSTGEGKWRLI
ncbi:MAG: rod shape-determining protein MreD [Clostridia bacterium]|nr:rod shape-determining protein MreD [Clostridia bacterium]NCC75340.1 rod shape-determining protein MreD [Clostridia bacterium]